MDANDRAKRYIVSLLGSGRHGWAGGGGAVAGNGCIQGHDMLKEL